MSVKFSIDELNAIVSTGDIVDKYLINCMKIENMNSKHLTEETELFCKLVEKISELCDPSEWELAVNNLQAVLKKQWDEIDICMDASSSHGERASASLRANLLNVDRIRCKNVINKMTGSLVELKTYGDFNE